MAKLRVSPSGKFIEGTQSGQILVWNHTLREWFPGAAPAGNIVQKTRPFGALAAPLDVLSIVPDSVIEFTAGQWAIGQAVFVESVFQIQGTSDGELQFEFWWSGDGVDWEPFFQPNGVSFGLSEGTSIAPLPMQYETPMIDENWESTSVFVGLALGKSGSLNANVTLGHILAQMIVPLPEG